MLLLGAFGLAFGPCRHSYAYVRSSVEGLQSGRIIREIEARSGSLGMRGSRVSRPLRGGLTSRISAASAPPEARPPRSLQDLMDCLQPVRDWNSLLLWLKKVRVDSNRWGVLEDWRKPLGVGYHLFSTDITGNGLRPTAGFLSQTRGDLELLRWVTATASSAGAELSEKSEASRVLELFNQGESRLIERRSWSNEELDLLAQWVGIRDRALTQAAFCVQSRMLGRESSELTQEVEPNRLRSLKAWSVGRASLNPDSTLPEEQREFSARAMAWVLGHLGVTDHPRFAQSPHQAQYRLYYDALLLGLIPRPTGPSLTEASASLWRTPVESVLPVLATLESEGASHTSEFLNDWLSTYRDYRDSDQPAIPLHPVPAP